MYPGECCRTIDAASITVFITLKSEMIHDKTRVVITSCDAAQYLLLPMLLWVNGLVLELMGSSDTGWRKSYGLRIRGDKLNNCVVVGGATTAEHKREQILFHMDTNKTIKYVFICQLLYLQYVCVCFIAFNG